MKTQAKPSRLRRAGVLAALAALIALPGCGGAKATWIGSGSGSGLAASALTPVITTPRDNATDVPTATEIVYTSKGATSTTVQMTDENGEAVQGAMRPDGSSWVPAKQLEYGATYTVKVTATGADGRQAAKTITFTTMSKPAKTVRIHSYVGDGNVVGVGMPLVLTFDKAVPKDQRAAVQRRLFMNTEPAQEGIWNWFSPTEVHYRPKEYWQPGTKLHLRAALGGLPMGGDAYGVADLTVDASVGYKLVIEVDNVTKQMTVTKDGQLLRTMPVSLGKPSAPSSSGNMVVMEKKQEEWFDSSTYGVPVNSPDGYRTKVYWDLRLTWGGEYIHAAPWSVADQGKRNVSHGCANLSTENAKWLFQLAQPGDPVIVKNTEQHLKWGDGWTDWDVPWEEYVKGSALPYQPGGGPSPAPSAS